MVGAAETAAPPEIASVQSVGGHPQQKVLCSSVQSVGGHPKQAEAIRGSLFSATVSRLVTNIACYSARRVGRQVQGWSRQVQGENIVRYCTENAAIETKSVKTPPPERAKLFNICYLETQNNSLC